MPNNIKLDKDLDVKELDKNSKSNIINLKENEDEKIKDSKTLNNNNNIQPENFGFQEQVVTYLTSTKERIINLAFEMGYKGYFPLFNKNINERLQEFHNISSNNFNV